jgi:hypothetical protein
MAADITTQLIKMVMGRSPQAQGVAASNSALGSSADLLSTASNYAQLYGTAAPAVQWTVGQIVASVAMQTGSSAKEADALAAAISSTGIGSVAVSVLVLLEVILNTVGGSDQTELFDSIKSYLHTNVIDPILAHYWLDKLSDSTLEGYWIKLKGDIDDLARQGTGGNNVYTDATSPPGYQKDGYNFVTELVDGVSVILGEIPQYWQIYSQPAGDVPQASDLNPNGAWGRVGWKYRTWYGKFPQRLAISDSPSESVLDPRTFMPVLATGLRLYMMLMSLVKFIDPTQQTLPEFLNQYWGDFIDPNSPTSITDGVSQAYINFLYEMYQVAVNGIVKTDVPSDEEILGSLWWLAQLAGVFASPDTNPNQPTNYSWGAPEWTLPGQYPQGGTDDPGPAFSGNGFDWNRVYGASETYPQYGFYGNYQLDQKQLNLFTQAYIVSSPDATNAVSQWQESYIIRNVVDDSGNVVSGPLVSIQAFEDWTIPWLQNRVILGCMARWKAIYLLNGFDRVWSVLQALQRLVFPFLPTGTTPIVPSTMMVKQDGWPDTIATGNWSVRELCKVVRVRGNLLNPQIQDNEFVVTSSQAVGTVSGHSVAGLVDFLWNVAMGNWAGPPQQEPYDLPPPSMSFRALLAAAAA